MSVESARPVEWRLAALLNYCFLFLMMLVIAAILTAAIMA